MNITAAAAVAYLHVKVTIEQEDQYSVSFSIVSMRIVLRKIEKSHRVIQVEMAQ